MILHEAEYLDLQSTLKIWFATCSIQKVFLPTYNIYIKSKK